MIRRWKDFAAVVAVVVFTMVLEEAYFTVQETGTHDRSSLQPPMFTTHTDVIAAVEYKTELKAEIQDLFTSPAPTAPLQNAGSTANKGNWKMIGGRWLNGRHPLACFVGLLSPKKGNITGGIEIFPSAQPDAYFKRIVKNSKKRQPDRFAHLRKEVPWWDKDLSDRMVCTSCCDGRQMGCASHFFQSRVLTKKQERKFKGKMMYPFKAAFVNGIMKEIGNHSVNKDALLMTGLPIHPRDNISEDTCDEWYREPTVILKNGDWTRETSKRNIGHWLADIMGIFLHATATHNVKRVLPLVPNCPIAKPGPTKQCRTFKLETESYPQQHLKATPFKEGTWFVFDTPDRFGIPWLHDIFLPPPKTHNRTVCFEKLVWGCPYPRACPTPKYISLLMPLYQFWLTETYGLNFTHDVIEEDGCKHKGNLVILTRDPQRSRYITNWEALFEASKGKACFKTVRRVEMWNATEKLYPEMVSAFQNADAVISMHGADLAMGHTLMRRDTVGIEILPMDTEREDPFYVYQAHGAHIHLIRWLVNLDYIPEWGNFNGSAVWDYRGRYNNHKSWRRQLKNFTLPVEGWVDVLEYANLLLETPPLPSEINK